MKKYSESKINTAQKFLSKYSISFDALDEPQKETVVNYTLGRKYLTVCLVLLIFVFVVFILGVYTGYNRSLATFDNVSEASAAGKTINFHKYGKLCLKRGFTIGVQACGAFFILINFTTLPLILKVKQKIFDAFLPTVKHLSDHIDGLKGQNTLAQGNALGEKTAP